MNRFFNENRSLEQTHQIYNQRIQDANTVWDKFHTEFQKRDCPFCDFSEGEDCDKFLDKYGVQKCLRCSSLYVNPCPNISALIHYYNECPCNEMLDKLFRQRAKKNNDYVNDSRVTKAYDLLKKFNNSNNDIINVLEIGCGSGSFLNKLYLKLKDSDLDESKFCLHGIDLDEKAVNQNTNPHVHLSVGDAAELNDHDKFDLVIHFELIEHLINPGNFMDNVLNSLKSGGVTYFTTPNSLGLEIKMINYNQTRLLAHGIFPPMHLNAFNTQNIGHFLLYHGFKLKSVDTPGVFDVSILLSTPFDNDDERKAVLGELDRLRDVDDETLNLIQSTIAHVNGSSHMSCVAQK